MKGSTGRTITDHTRPLGVPVDSSRPKLVHPSFDPQTDGGLTKAVGRYFAGGIKEATWARYETSCRHFMGFMTLAGRTRGGVCPVPSEMDLVFYASHRARRGIKPAGIRQELTAIGQLFTAHGLDHPILSRTKTDSGLRLHRVLRGIAVQHSAAKRTRLPLTVGLLRKIRPVLGLACPWLNGPDRDMYWAALCLGVYGMFRISELAAPKARQSAPGTTRRADIHESRGCNGTVLLVKLRCSKTDFTRQGVTIKVFENGTETCPVTAYRKYQRAATPHAPEDPAFVLTDGSYLTRERLTTVLRRSLTFLGFDATAYASHSLRIGGVVSAAAAGYGIETLKKLGRWASDAVLVYLQLPEAMLRTAHKDMARVSDKDLENSDIRNRAYAARRGHV